ncbi:HupE/UreJ family protein [Roseateles saccharophilus]|uniref:Urease accessory protein n=1 Tax=Roseateles saccharophilus TaxID=304 RepID=A0A4R3UPR6_ROSSA|nr:HupE/UreJ family protein [Roseateles saccharophilus]MDG0833314.1 HupE/UreJ family protein [Roseateles saccharophilus]TCU93765.1 urease accessory protein [Roseateles saccharophilus]
MQDLKTLSRRAAFAALALLATGAAQAHPGHDGHSLVDGFLHPFAGLDHLLAMAAVGLWSAAELPAGRRLAGPAVFLAMLLLGAVLPQFGLLLPGLEAGVAVSVVALGVLMIAARQPALRLPVPVGLGLVGLAALLHGMAHGAELAVGQSFAAYAAGFMTASALLHGAGLVAGGWLQAGRVWAWRATAGLVGASGLAMLAGRL